MTKTERTVRGRATIGDGAGALGQHVAGCRHPEFGIADHRVVDGVTLGLLDVARPLRMVLDRIDAEADDLGIALVELRLQPGHVAEFRGADRGESWK